MSASSGCLHTTIRNTSGVAMTFGFLPPHGRTLAAGEQITIRGSLGTRLIAGPGGARKFTALEHALDLGNLAIVSTPAVHLFDAERETTKVLTTVGGEPTLADPCWGTYVSM